MTLKNRPFGLLLTCCLHLVFISASGRELVVTPAQEYNTLQLNESLLGSQQGREKLRSSDSQFIFDIQVGGGRHSLALRDKHYITPICWKATTVKDSGTTRVLLRKNGNLVFESSSGELIWESGTGGMGVTRLTLGDDGALSLFAEDRLIRSLYSVSSDVPSALTADKSRGEWTLMVVPDLQGYTEDWSERGYNYDKMKHALAWITAIKDSLNIKVVQSVGDMIEVNNKVEWDRLQKCWDGLLKSGLPAIPCGGNHELDDNYVMLNQYYSPSKFQKYSWWKGYQGGVQNSYQFFDIGNEKYIFITLEHLPETELVSWAKKLISVHSERKVILTTHHLDVKLPFYQELFDAGSKNIVLALAGHVTSERNWLDQYGCHCFVQDYQAWSEKMNLRYFKFKPLEDKVEWYTYSPTEEKWETDFFSQGSFPLAQKNP